MKVSFLVTYYNQKEYVQQSLDSILAIEKPCEWEIIVGDDGSTDGTIERVNEYIKKYPDNIRMYVMPRERGKKYDAVKRASANRLNILKHSLGDIYCTLDGDDHYCDTTFIKDAVNIFKNKEDVSIVAFGFCYNVEGVLKDPILLPVKVKYRYIEKKDFLKNFYIHAGACVHKKSFDHDRIEYIAQLGYFDDNNIVINSLNYGEMFAVNRAIYAYRQTGQSIYTSMDELEQAVLNVQGLDVDIRLVEKDLKETIIERYSTAIILMYIWRKKIHLVLGENKCKKYEEGCKSLMPSYCYRLLEYKDVGDSDKELEIMIKKVLWKKKSYVIKQYIKYYLKEIFK